MYSVKYLFWEGGGRSSPTEAIKFLWRGRPPGPQTGFVDGFVSQPQILLIYSILTLNFCIFWNFNIILAIYVAKFYHFDLSLKDFTTFLICF